VVLDHQAVTGDPRVSLFPSDTARDIWRGHWCERCFQPDEADFRLHGNGFGCQIIARALSSDRKPREWDRNTRAQTMSAAYGCNAFLAKPAVARRGKAPDETLPMFELEPADGRALVPVDGWPDYRAEQGKPKKADHA
jgi:hypothetical protein